MGAKAMLEDGLFTRFPQARPEHRLPRFRRLPAGVIGYTPGSALANVDTSTST